MSLAYPTSLAQYAVAQFKEGRRVGTPTNTLDVTSAASTRKHGHRVESLTPYDRDDSWRAIAVEDRKSGPAEVAALRIDFDDWLSSLTQRQSSMASAMCKGFSTSELAENQSVSRSRISQIRRELEANWNQFYEDGTAIRHRPLA